MRALRNTERVSKNAGVDRVRKRARRRAPGQDRRIHDEVPALSRFMRWRNGRWRLDCGMVFGLIHGHPSVKELIDRTMLDAERLRDRLMDCLAPRAKAR